MIYSVKTYWNNNLKILEADTSKFNNVRQFCASYLKYDNFWVLKLSIRRNDIGHFPRYKIIFEIR